MTPDIRPSSDIRNYYAEVSRSCREGRRPTILTVNGRGNTVISDAICREFVCFSPVLLTIRIGYTEPKTGG